MGASQHQAFVEHRQPVIWLLSLVIGLSVAWAAIGFRQLIGLVQLYWSATPANRCSRSPATHRGT
jgi:CIC family chloride channel protein